MKTASGPGGTRRSYKQQYHSLLELTREAVVVVCENGLIREANAHACKLAAYGRAELLRMALFDLIHEDDRIRCHNLLDAATPHGKQRAILRIMRGDGSPVQQECCVSKLNDGDLQMVLRDPGDQPRRELDLQHQNRAATALYEIGRQISSSFDIDQVLDSIVKNTGWLLECQFAGVALVDPPFPGLVWRSTIGGRRDSHDARSRRGVDGMLGRVLETQAPVVMRNEKSDPFLGVEDLMCALAVPLVHKGRAFGALVAGYRSEHQFDGDDTMLLSNLADNTALALENARLYQSTLDSANTLKALSARLTVVQEQERGKIARELHDGIGQALTAVRLNLEILCREVPITDILALERVGAMTAIIDETLKDIRHMAFELRPTVLDDFGLSAALRIYVERFVKQTGIAVHLHCPDGDERWDSHVEATLFRVVQESLTNVAKHANATEATIAFSAEPPLLTLDITDNGIGFEPPYVKITPEGRESLGILNMKQRITGLSGTFAVRSGPGRGTCIHVTIPVAA